MSFDSFRKELREDFQAALRGGADPVLDLQVADEDERARLHEEAVRRVAALREGAVRDVVRRKIVRMLSIRIGELWRAGAYRRDFDEAPLVVHAQQLMGSNDPRNMLDAAALFSIVAAIRLARQKD